MPKADCKILRGLNMRTLVEPKFPSTAAWRLRSQKLLAENGCRQVSVCRLHRTKKLLTNFSCILAAAGVAAIVYDMPIDFYFLVFYSIQLKIG